MIRTSDQILSRLPHRPPFRFITDITELEPGVLGEATWRVTGAEAFLEGHFPGEPIVPGVLIVEALAQLSGLVAFHNDSYSQSIGGRLAHVDIRFDGSAIPPAQIKLHAQSTRVIGALHLFDVSATLDGITIARGQLTLALIEQVRTDPNPSGHDGRR